MAAFDKLRQEAIKSGKTVGDLGKDSKQSAQVIEDAFGSTASGIAKSMTDAAKGLSDTLAKMDANLTAAIGSLQTAMVTMINDLISVILGIPGAAEKAATGANFFLGGIKDRSVSVTINTSFDDAGLRELEARIARLDATATGQLRKFTDPLAGTEGAKPSVKTAEGGIVTRPTVALIGERGPEAVIPLGKMGGDVYHVTNEFHISGTDPATLKQTVEQQIALT